MYGALCYFELIFFRHPDKSSDPSASDKFVQIVHAYELLNDPERRRKYDLRGITEDNSHMRPEGYSYADDHYEEMFNHFRNQENEITFFHKLAINTRYEIILYIKNNIAVKCEVLFHLY